MKIAEYCELMHLEEVPDSIVLAAVYLEAKGYKFCVDFGFMNACEIAEEVYSREAA